jgi:hypothetical protein
MQSWETAYQSNLLSASNVSNYDVMRPNYTSLNYESLTGNSEPPVISKMYDDMLANNQQTQNYMNNNGLYPNYAPYPLPGKLSIPQVHPPLNTTYPTNGYSPKDNSLAYNSNYVESIANIPVPLSSVTATKDARQQNSYVIDQNNPMVIKHGIPEQSNIGVKEKFDDELDNLQCLHVYNHSRNCPMCRGYFTRNEKSLLIIIGFLVAIIIFLLVMLSKAKK